MSQGQILSIYKFSIRGNRLLIQEDQIMISKEQG